MAEKIKLGYWGIRGLAQVSRLLLAYTEADWENVAYTDPNAWFATDKPTLGLDFPNLPYLIEGDFKITESSAVERYIIERSNHKELLGKNAQDAARVNQIIGVLTEIRSNLSKLFFDKDYEAKLKQTWEKYKPKFDALEKVAGDNAWILGQISYADFYIAELANYWQKLYPEEFKNYASFNRIRQNFNNLEQIKKYYASEGAIKGPFLPPNFAVVKL